MNDSTMIIVLLFAVSGSIKENVAQRCGLADSSPLLGYIQGIMAVPGKFVGESVFPGLMFCCTP